MATLVSSLTSLVATAGTTSSRGRIIWIIKSDDELLGFVLVHNFLGKSKGTLENLSYLRSII